jgi:dethiobiotin synthetase
MAADLFVTGTDTNVGKTLLSALLVAALDGIYWKPIQTGASEGTDRQTVMQWAEISEDRTAPEAYRFGPPVSPHLAAEAAGVTIRLKNIWRPEPREGPLPEGDRRLIVEGAGGILVPINETETMLDLVRYLHFPVVVAARTALGTINHTSLTVRVLRDAGIEILGVVMIGPRNCDNERAIERHAAVPVIGRIPWLETINRSELLRVYESDFDREYFEAFEP